MGQSRNTYSASLRAVLHVRRDKLGKAILPRVVEHPPLPGDVHPLNRQTLLKLLPMVPLRYLQGIRAIELRARPFGSDTQPRGTYEPRHKLVRLYSQPFPDKPIWKPLEDTYIHPDSILGICGATIIERDGRQFLHWPNRKAYARYFFARVFAHELGHHHVYQHRYKRRMPGSSRGHEARADALAWQMQGLARFDAVFGRDDPGSAVNSADPYWER
jgi:hypothetical protein